MSGLSCCLHGTLCSVHLSDERRRKHLSENGKEGRAVFTLVSGILDLVEPHLKILYRDRDRRNAYADESGRQPVDVQTSNCQCLKSRLGPFDLLAGYLLTCSALQRLGIWCSRKLIESLNLFCHVGGSRSFY